MMAVDRGGTRVAFQADDHRIYVVDDNGIHCDDDRPLAQRHPSAGR